MYAIKKSLYLSVSAIILCGGSGNVFASGLPQTTHTRHISLSDSAPSYQIASIQWLPDALEEGLKFSGFSSGGGGTDGGHGKGDGCDSKYNLSQCPANGTCDRCAFANKYYLKGCDNGYKVNTTGSACVELSDTCPSGYYKSCSDGTEGSPEYTEKGTACYKCKVVDTCPSGYEKYCSYGTNGTPKYTEKGTACYKCCSSSYKYDLSNCPDETHRLCDRCGEKYYTCSKLPYSLPSNSDETYEYFGSDETVDYCGLTFTFARDKNYRNTYSNCPNYEANSDFYTFYKEFNEPIHSAPYIHINSTSNPSALACYNGDRACIDAYLKFQKNKEVTLDKDINCGALGWYLKDSGTYTINGNGHTITFDKPTGDGFHLDYQTNNIILNINNTKIIFRNSNCSDFISDVCYSTGNSRTVFSNSDMRNYGNKINLTNVDVDISGSPNAWIGTVVQNK